MFISRLSIKNFKKFDEIEFNFDSPVVLIGPNNSGKTSVLQAITLLEAGLKRISAEKKKGTVRVGVSINRKDLISIPIPEAKLLWHNKNVRFIDRNNGKQFTKNITIEIRADGYIKDKPWQAYLEFDFANDESFYCRALRKDQDGKERHKINQEAFQLRVAYLQPMSGLAAQEDRLTPGSIDRKIGEGRTADVIRNICYQLLHPERIVGAAPQQEIEKRWGEMNSILDAQFGIRVNEPVFNPDNGLLTMTYIENDVEYDLSSSGRGFQQTLLLLSFLYANPERIIIMDEPDAHLEVLRQREIYDLISDITRKLNSQLIVATHSEAVMDQAASKDKIIAILEKSAIHLNDQHKLKNAKKSLTDVGWSKYYLAKQKKHCLFLEGSTDLHCLKAFAKLIDHPSYQLLSNAFIDYVEGNLPNEALKRFDTLRLAEPALKGLAIFDRLDRNVSSNLPLEIFQWQFREIENYFCKPDIFLRWAESKSKDLFSQNYAEDMRRVVEDIFPKIYLNDPENEWWKNEKLSEWAERIFQEFFKRSRQPVKMRKGDLHELINFMKPQEVNSDIILALDKIEKILAP